MVAGGGPAGLLCAILLGRCGYSVKVVEQGPGDQQPASGVRASTEHCTFCCRSMSAKDKPTPPRRHLAYHLLFLHSRCGIRLHSSRCTFAVCAKGRPMPGARQGASGSWQSIVC